MFDKYNKYFTKCWKYGIYIYRLFTIGIGSKYSNSCRNIGNVIIESSEVMNAIHCFISTTTTKNVYIPFNSTTYNSFINAGYDENRTQHGVYLKDINSL